MESRLSRRAARLAIAAVATLAGPLGCSDEDPVDAPLVPPFVARSEDQLLTALQDAYAHRDLHLFSEVIAIEDGAVYEFHFPDPPNGEAFWDATEELRMHRRLFEPENVLPGEPPASCPWLLHLVVAFERESPSWTERPEYYRSASNPGGLDADRWRATGAIAQSECFVETASENDYRLESRSEFVVIEDRVKPLGAERKFLLYRWLDLDGRWKAIKTMCP